MQDYIINNWIEILGVITGLVYLYQEIKASIYMWITGIIMPVISLFVYYEVGLYADFGINIYYCLASIYGIIVWLYGKKKDEKELPITRMPRKKCLPLAICFAACFIGISFILQTYTDSTVPWWDSLTTSLSIIAMWMLARKWIEQWWVWIAVDVISSGLYTFKGIYLYAALYMLYAIIAIYGYYKWKEFMKADDVTTKL